MTPIYSNSTLSPFPTTVESSTITDHDHSDHGDLDQVIQQHHHHYHQHLLFSSTSPTSSSSLTSFPTIFFNNPIQDHVENFGRDHEDNQLEVMNKYVLHGGSSSNDHQPHQFFPSHDDSSHPTLDSTTTSTTMVDHQETSNYGSGLKLSIYEQEEEEVVDEEEEDNKDHDDNDYKHIEIGSSVKWMSSKMRLMKKMMNKPNKFDQSSAYSPPSNKDNNNNTIRVCADCNTTKTPLWRSGPRGPKSLCNACGIRQRKARRAMADAAAAAAATNDDKVVVVANDRKETISSSAPKNNIKNSSTATVTTAIPAATTTTESGCTNNSMMPYKKRCKIVGPSSNYDDDNNNNNNNNSNNNNNNNNSRKKLCFEDFTISLMSNSSLDHQQVFPQDEKEAAILLMALSYGLVHG